MADPRQIQRTSTGVMSIAMVVIGVVLLVSTLIRGGGPLSTGVIFGILFFAAGLARLFLLGRRSKDA